MTLLDNGGFIGRTADYSDTSFYEYFPDINYDTAINSVSGGAPDFRWTLDATTNEEGSLSTTPTGTFSYTTGLIQTAPEYQSADMSGSEYLTIANDPLINGGTGYVWTKRSISFWFNADTTGSGTYPCIWEEGGGANWMSIYLDNGLIYANVGESSTTGGHATASVSTGTTYHCLVTFDLTLGSNNIKIYLNGSLAGQATSSVGTDLLEHVGDVRIGSGSARNHLNANITYASYNGRLQDVCYWNEVALTATDASDIYNSSFIVIGNKKNTGLWNLDASYKNFLPDIYTNSLVLWMDAVNEKSYGVSENLIQNSTNLSTTTWTTSGSITSTATTGPDGTNTAYTLTDNDASAPHAAIFMENDDTLYETIQKYTAICYIEKTAANTGPWAVIQVYFISGGVTVGTPAPTVYVRPDTGDIVKNLGVISAETTEEDGWWRVIFDFNSYGSGYDRIRLNLYPAVSSNGSLSLDVATTGSNVFWNPQIQRGPKENFSRIVKTSGSLIKRETRWWDVSGQNNDGVVTGGAVYNSTYFEFDGLDDYIELGTITTSNPLQLSSPADGGLTIMFATYWDGTGDSFQRIIDKSDGGNALNGWCIFPNSNGTPANQLIFRENPGPLTGDGTNMTSTSILSTGVWEIWAVTHDQSSGNWSWYKNGVLDNSGTDTYVTPSAQTNARIGTWNHDVAREWNGRIGFMLVYEKALTQQEITQNYNALKGSYGL
jgi:hypothetical protein